MKTRRLKTTFATHISTTYSIMGFIVIYLMQTVVYKTNNLTASNLVVSTT